MELIYKKKFANAALDENFKAFVIYMTSLISKMTIHPIGEAQIALLITKKVAILVDSLNYTDIFSKKLAEMLLE